MKSSSRTSGGLMKRKRDIALQGPLHRLLTALERRLLGIRAAAASRHEPLHQLRRRVASQHLRDDRGRVVEDRRLLALVVALRHREHAGADRVEAARIACRSLAVQELLLMDEALEIEEADAALLLLDDLAGFRGRPGEAAHVAERDALGAEAALGADQVLHRLLERHL